MWLQKQLGEEALCQIEQSKICVCMKAVIFMEKKKKKKSHIAQDKVRHKSHVIIKEQWSKSEWSCQTSSL